MVGAVGEMASVKRRKLWKTGEDGLCFSSSAIQTRLGPSSLLEERSGVSIVFVVLLCCRLPPKLGEMAKVYRIDRFLLLSSRGPNRHKLEFNFFFSLFLNAFRIVISTYFDNFHDIFHFAHEARSAIRGSGHNFFFFSIRAAVLSLLVRLYLQKKKKDLCPDPLMALRTSYVYCNNRVRYLTLATKKQFFTLSAIKM